MPLKPKFKVHRKNIYRKQLEKKLREAAIKGVSVGFPMTGQVGSPGSPGNPGEDNKNAFTSIFDIIKIAAVNNFGTNDGRIPSRPFMSIAFRDSKYRSRLRRVLIAEAQLIMRPKVTTVEQSYNRIGLAGVAVIKAAIRDLDTPPNAPATQVGKFGVDNPLIDTGQMINSVQHTVVKDF